MSNDKIHREDLFWKKVIERTGNVNSSVRVSNSSMDNLIGDSVKFNNESESIHAWPVKNGWMCATLTDGNLVEHRAYENLASAMKHELCSSKSGWKLLHSEAEKLLHEQLTLPAVLSNRDSDSTLMSDNVVSNPFLLTYNKFSDFSPQRRAALITEKLLNYCESGRHTPEEALNTFKYSINSSFGDVKTMHSCLIDKSIASKLENVLDTVLKSSHDYVSNIIGDLDVNEKNDSSNNNQLQNTPSPSLTPSPGNGKKDKKKEEELLLRMSHRPRPSPS